MRKYITKIIIITFVLLPNTLAQNQIKINPSIGIFIYNSDNSLKIMERGKYILNYGFEISYINKNLFGKYIQFDYSYIYEGVDETSEFIKTGTDNPTPNGVFYSDVSLSFNTLDFLLKNELSKDLFIGLGPSLSIVNKSINFAQDNFEDRLVSFNIGLSVTLDKIIPLNENSTNWYLNGGIKLRYLFGLYYDDKGRDLSNYNQEFFTLNILFGLGYNF